MASTKVRVRFAPAPTGMMHLGNIRTALINYLFALQKNGDFVLRIEDTDPERNFDPQALHIQEDLAWLGISWNEGICVGGDYGPYFQSQRSAIYRQNLDYIAQKGLAYRCFCTEDELNKKRERQQLLKLPPRYDRTCLNKTEKTVEELLAANTPFIWRFKLDHAQTVTINDLARGPVSFELQHFSDPSLTRQDGSFTFIFANFIDDLTMRITHIFRGEEHFSNTAGQAALYSAFDAEIPTFFHTPLICNINGQKLSKRDFGFSLRDLRAEGFIPEAINNYLGILGASFEQEIMSIDQLAQAINFDSIHTTGHIKYDVEKLRWLNHKWITRYSTEQLTAACKPLLLEAYPDTILPDNPVLGGMLELVKTDLITLKDCVQSLAFYFKAPVINRTEVSAILNEQEITLTRDIVASALTYLSNERLFIDELKKAAKKQSLELKKLFWFTRLALTGHCQGPAIHDIIAILGSHESHTRLENILKLI